MNAAGVYEAQRLVGELADLAMELPPHGNGGDMALHLRVAQLYLAEFAGHLSTGGSVREALMATARPNVHAD